MKKIILICLVFFGLNLFATENYNQVGQITLETINQLEKNGYITKKNALEAKKEFVFNKSNLLIESSTKEEILETDVSWTEYLSLVNFLKTLGVIACIIAFRGVILNFVEWFTKIPQYIYQGVLLSTSIILTFLPELISESEAIYISMFAVFANIIILSWIFFAYEEFWNKILSFISLKIPLDIAVAFYLTIYFGFFAIYLDSSLIGVFAAIAFVGMFSFTMESTGVCTSIGYRDENFIVSGLIISFLTILIYGLVTIYNINVPYLNNFYVGIEYVLTVVLSVSLLILSSFVFQEEKLFGLAVFLFIISFLAGNVAMFLFNLAVIPVIINTAFAIFVLGWLNYLTFKINGIFAMFVSAVLLYGSGLIIETYPEYFVTNLF